MSPMRVMLTWMIKDTDFIMNLHMFKFCTKIVSHYLCHEVPFENDYVEEWHGIMQ